MARAKAVPKMTPGRAVLVALMNRYLGGLMDPWVSLLELHKLMYFAQESGLSLKLKYRKAAYGPYAENLRHVLNHIEGHFVSGYLDGGDKPTKPLQLVPGTYKDATGFLEGRDDVTAAFERVSQLIDGFETPFGMELLATVHWVAARQGATDVEAAVDAVHQWNERKRQFTPRQVRVAWDVLAEQGWLQPRALN